MTGGGPPVLATAPDATAHLAKPMRLDVLLATVDAVLHRAHATS